LAAKDPLFGNKVAAAGLVALLLIFGIPQLVGALFGGSHGGGHGDKIHLAYPIDYEAESAAGGEAAGPKKDLGTLLAEAKPEAGERRVALCKSCHTLDKGGANLQGPNLFGTVGRTVASHGGFNYSAALKGHGGSWDFASLDKFIENSQGYIPGTAMNQHVAKPEHRAEILVYLNTLSDAPLALPAPAAPAAEAAAPAEAPAAPEAAPAAAQPGH
jgi:cytochrome c